MYGSCNKVPNYNRIQNTCSVNFSRERLTLTGNFTKSHKEFGISVPLRRANMQQDMMNMANRRTESRMTVAKGTACVDENPLYEDPRDVIGELPIKPPRKRALQGLAVPSPRSSTKDNKTGWREQKKKLTKKYEQLINSLSERCEENLAQLSQKDDRLLKLKEKLKVVLKYNDLFAEENDQLKSQHETLVKYIEACKKVIKEERDRNRELELKLEEKVKQYEMPDRDNESPTAIPLVEVCMSCSSRQIIVNQAREHNSRLQKDMQALKDVLYRLNTQLSRYQEKLRNTIQTNAGEGDQEYKVPDNKFRGLESLIKASFGFKGAENAHADEGAYTKHEDQPQANRTVDRCGLLSAQALAPLFDAYQENLQEKDSLILDYEKQFEIINKKSKQIVSENNALCERVKLLEDELTQARQSYKKLLAEKETANIERATLVERAERAESKLKEVYESYESKITAMMRDYETVHREYYSVKSALEQSETKLAQSDVMRGRTVPADLHERRLDNCKRLLEELKHQYAMETERKDEQITKLQDQLRTQEEKCTKLSQDKEKIKGELEKALKNVRLYRKAAVIFRYRLRAANVRASRARTSTRRKKNNNEPLRHAMAALDNIKREIKAVKSRAYTSLEELERRIMEQQKRASLAHAEYRRELERASLALEHKEAIIRSLIDKVADVEEVRLSQTNTTHRLQGIVTDSSLESDSNHDRKEAKPAVKLVPGHGGYFQEKEAKGSKKRSNK